MTVAPRNLIITGGIFHPFEEASEALARILSQVGITSEVTLDLEEGLEQVAAGEFDLLTIYALRWRMIQKDKYEPYRDQWALSLSQQGRETITRFISSGGALLGLHTASICFDDWPAWRDVLGGQWDWDVSFHPPLASIRAEPTGAAHPIVGDAEAFELNDEIYHHLNPTDDVVPLLQATADEGPQPVLWAREFGRGRVVYDALGHDAAALNHPTHAGILRRSALWALRNLESLDEG